MHAVFHFSFMFTLAAMICGLMAGIYAVCRNQGMYSSDTLREVAIWGFGFIIYAVFDYFILMS